jgi:hypothetical protein
VPPAAAARLTAMRRRRSSLMMSLNWTLPGTTANLASSMTEHLASARSAEDGRVSPTLPYKRTGIGCVVACLKIRAPCASAPALVERTFAAGQVVGEMRLHAALPLL